MDTSGGAQRGGNSERTQRQRRGTAGGTRRGATAGGTHREDTTGEKQRGGTAGGTQMRTLL